MPPIRQLMFAILVIMLFAYGSILFIGGYEVQNHLGVNSTIYSNFNAINNNTNNPGGLFGNTSGIIGSTNITKSGVNNTGSSSVTLTNSVGLVVGFIGSIPQTYGAIINFIALPFEVAGVRSGYAHSIANLFFVFLIAIAIASAIFLFPLIASANLKRKRYKK